MCTRENPRSGLHSAITEWKRQGGKRPETRENEIRERDACSSSVIKDHHVLMIPHPSLLHISPMLHLAEQLVGAGNIKVTILSYASVIDPLIDNRVNLSTDIHFSRAPHDLPEVERVGPRSVDISIDRLEQAAEEYVKKCVRDKANNLPDVPSFLVSDFLHLWTVKVSDRLEIPRFVMFPTSACSVALILAFREVGGYEKVIMTSPEKDGRRIQVDKLPYFTLGDMCMENPTLVRVIEQSIMLSAGILINTFEELEREALYTVRRLVRDVYVLPVGPMEVHPPAQPTHWEVPNLRERAVKKECMEYLEIQLKQSVLYVNLGTLGMRERSRLYTHELAHGLETSGEQFLWVLCPLESSIELPVGFERRMKNRGLVVRGPAPHLEILSHRSIAAFMTHCGWNSSLESITRGVPIIACPAYTDQLQNARYLADKADVAWLLPRYEDFLLTREDIELSVNIVYFSQKGFQMKEKASQLKSEILLVHEKCVQGSTYKNIQELIKIIVSRSCSFVHLANLSLSP